MTRKLLLTSAYLICSLLAFSQSLTVKGKVFNSLHQPLPGASVTCTSTASGAALRAITTDDGEFKFTALSKGNYEVQVDYVGYALYKTSFKLSDEKKELNIELTDNTSELQTVNVFTKINAESESSSRSSEKNANNITNVISARAMERSPDVNAANVLQRMSGITLQKNSGADEAYAPPAFLHR